MSALCLIVAHLAKDAVAEAAVCSRCVANRSCKKLRRTSRAAAGYQESLIYLRPNYREKHETGAKGESCILCGTPKMVNRCVLHGWSAR